MKKPTEPKIRTDETEADFVARDKAWRVQMTVYRKWLRGKKIAEDPDYLNKKRDAHRAWVQEYRLKNPDRPKLTTNAPRRRKYETDEELEKRTEEWLLKRISYKAVSRQRRLKAVAPKPVKATKPAPSRRIPASPLMDTDGTEFRKRTVPSKKKRHETPEEFILRREAAIVELRGYNRLAHYKRKKNNPTYRANAAARSRAWQEKCKQAREEFSNLLEVGGQKAIEDFKKNWELQNPGQVAVYDPTHQEAQRARNAEARKKPKHKERLSAYEKRRRKEDPQFRILSALRASLASRLKRAGARKSEKTMLLISCSIKCFMEHLEGGFEDGMSWNNYGEWSMDHIVPCAAFDMTNANERARCWHYTNFQPLWKLDNLRKGARLDWVAVRKSNVESN